MYDKHAQYAINKYCPDEIRYQDAYWRYIRLVPNDFESVEIFTYWKKQLTNEFQEEDRGNTEYSDHSTSLTLESDYADNRYNPEMQQMQQIEKQESQSTAEKQLAFLKQTLTPKQYRRLWLRYAEGLKEREIAELEGCSHQMISKSIRAAKKKIQKKLGRK